MYALFVLQPLVLTVQYSLYRWDGVGPATWVGLSQLRDGPERAASSSRRSSTPSGSIVFFSLIPVALGLVTASVIQRVATGRLGTVSRTVLFLPQVIPLVAAGIIWGWLLSLVRARQPGPDGRRPRRRHAGLARRLRHGPAGRRHHRDLGAARASARSCCSTGMTKIDPALYESARIDGAGWFQEFRRHHRAEPPERDRRVPHGDGHRRARRVRHRLRLHRRRARQRHGGARASRSTSWPSSSAQVGLASALAVVLVVLVLVVHPPDPAPDPGERRDEGRPRRALDRPGAAPRADGDHDPAVPQHLHDRAPSVGHRSQRARVAGRSAVGQLRRGVQRSRTWARSSRRACSSCSASCRSSLVISTMAGLRDRPPADPRRAGSCFCCSSSG